MLPPCSTRSYTKDASEYWQDVAHLRARRCACARSHQENERTASTKDCALRLRRFGAPQKAAVACAWVRAYAPATAGCVPEDRPARTCPWRETRRLAIRDCRCALYWR